MKGHKSLRFSTPFHFNCLSTCWPWQRSYYSIRTALLTLPSLGVRERQPNIWWHTFKPSLWKLRSLCLFGWHLSLNSSNYSSANELIFTERSHLNLRTVSGSWHHIWNEFFSQGLGWRNCCQLILIHLGSSMCHKKQRDVKQKSVRDGYSSQCARLTNHKGKRKAKAL